MAIIIPSKNTYDRQNPKVRDNVIERIEVGVVEGSQKNEYDIAVYNAKFSTTDGLLDKSQIDRNIVGEAITTGANIGVNAIWVANAEVSNQKTINKTIIIPKIKENSLVYSILTGKDKDGKNQIKYTIHGDIRKGTCYQSISWELPDGFLVNPITPNFNNIGKINFNEYNQEEVGKTFDYYSEVTSTYKGKPHDNIEEREVVATLIPNDISKVISIQNNENEFIVSINIMSSIIISRLGGSSWVTGVGGTFDISGTYEEYIPNEIELTVYGNTIGIDLKDTTIYINGETAKKVHSIDGNELMQVGNYYYTEKKLLVENQDYNVFFTRVENESVAELTFSNAIEDFCIVNYIADEKNYSIITNPNGIHILHYKNSFSIVSVQALSNKKTFIQNKYAQTQNSYKHGKETATIRCSISDYYDNGEKAIAIDNSTGKMSFDIGDQVIPMVYGADGKDRPMSTYKDGSSKVFEVLGVKKFYDGAIWQELSLQEV